MERPDFSFLADFIFFLNYIFCLFLFDKVYTNQSVFRKFKPIDEQHNETD